MNFLTPWFLLGAAAIAGPILFHLIRQAVRERLPFSSLMFLRPTPRRVTRRRQLEHLWLLLLRCLGVALLAAAFARPFFNKNSAVPDPATEGRQLILLLDTSASMRRAGVWDQARTVAEKYLAQTGPGDQVAVLAFDRQPRTLFNFAEWAVWAPDQRAALGRQRLAAVSPGWLGTQLGLALTVAAEKFVDDTANGQPVSRREIVLISDLQEGAKLDGLQGHDWPANVHVVLERVDAPVQANAGLEIQNPAGAAASDDALVRARVTNARDSDREQFHLAWRAINGTNIAGTAMDIYLPPGQTRTFSAPALPKGTTTAELLLTGDAVDFDNRSYFSVPAAEHLVIAWFGQDSVNDPMSLRYYMQRVYQDTPGRQVKILSPDAPQGFSPEWLDPAVFAVIPGRLTPEEIAPTRAWLERGNTALFVVTDETAAATLALLTSLPDLKITEATGDYALLGTIDFTHPLFAPFADPRFSDFSHIHFWKHRHLELPSAAQARVLARFDDGSPALAQLPAGKGNLLVLAAGWNPADSQLALSSKFPPLMQTLLEWSGASAPARSQFETGETIPAPASSSNTAVQWAKPDGNTTELAAGVAFSDTDVPGIYTATVGGQQRQFAVNLPLEESRTAPMPPDDLARLGVPLQPVSLLPAAKVQETQRHLQQAELENQQKVWRWLIVGVLVILLAEMLLSGWLARRATAAGVSS